MTKVLPFLGNTELEVLSVFGGFLLVMTHVAMAYCVKEKVVIDRRYAVYATSLDCTPNSSLFSAGSSEKGFRHEVKELWKNARSLPSVIMQIVCTISVCDFTFVLNTLHIVYHPVLVSQRLVVNWML